MKLYHGTSERHLSNILKSGLVPRKRKNGNWSHTVNSNPNAVYLTNSYAIHFAQAACKGKERLMVLEIDTNKLDQLLLAPDEDFLEQATRNQEDGLPKSWSMEKRTRYFRKRALEEFGHLWKTSIEHLGTCAYYGTIPVEAINRIALINHDARLVFMSDPSITLLNYRFRGEDYRNLTKRIFDEPVTITQSESLHRQINPLFPVIGECSRSGIEIRRADQD